MLDQTMVKSESQTDCSTACSTVCDDTSRSSVGDSPKAREQVRRLPERTRSMPKRTLWKDKGGSARYILREEPKLEEVKSPSWEAVAKEALTDAVLTGGEAGLALYDAVSTTKLRLQRSLSNKGLGRTLSVDQHDLPFATQEAAGGPLSRFAGGRRELLQRAKSLGVIRGVRAPLMPQRPKSPERTIATTAA